MFFRGSRYEDVPTLRRQDDAGREVHYKAIRLIPTRPATERATSRPGERPDLLAHRLLLDSERFWRLCDANDVQWPPDLSADPQRTLRVPAPGE